jgi:hypothetical protein
MIVKMLMSSAIRLESASFLLNLLIKWSGAAVLTRGENGIVRWSLGPNERTRH